MSDPIAQISDILGAPKGWLDEKPQDPRAILQAVLNDVHPAALGDGYPHFLASVRHVGEQYGVSDL